MIIQLHTPEGIVSVDSDSVTDAELAQLKITREAMLRLVKRDLNVEIDVLKAQIIDLDTRLKRNIGGHIR